MKRVLPLGSVMERINPHLVNGIPVCPECKENAVRWRNNWVCRNCFVVADGAPTLGPPKTIPIGSVLPNRAARRRR